MPGGPVPDGWAACLWSADAMRSRLGRTPGYLPVSAWHGRRQAGAGLVDGRCKDIPPDASAPAVRTVADARGPGAVPSRSTDAVIEGVVERDGV